MTQRTTAPEDATTIQRWEVFEIALRGPEDDDSFIAPRTRARFTLGHRSIEITGFYDGSGDYRVRFMPDAPGEWEYLATGPTGEQVAGAFTCVEAATGNHGPVVVADTRSFAYSDGSRYEPYGTTAYAWIHQDPERQEETLATLADSPFNKIRMCVFPKNYAFNEAEPVRFPFQRREDGSFDLRRFDPEFFVVLEARIRDLMQLNIECDLILFHPYDKGRWGFDELDEATNELYLRYLIARLAAFRNIWWSIANEYDFVEHRTMPQWDRLFHVVEECDPYHRLASIHNGTRMYHPDSLALYDHRQPWVTHVSLQHWDLNLMPVWVGEWDKPVVVDECGYEGNLPQRWGNLTGRRMVDMFWTGFLHGGYVGHGETFYRENGPIWWSHGGPLEGESPERIAFLRRVMAELPDGAQPLRSHHDVATMGIDGEFYLQYFGEHRPCYRDLRMDPQTEFEVEVIDAWDMTVTKLPGRFAGSDQVPLPSRTHMAIRARAVARDG